MTIKPPTKPEPAQTLDIVEGDTTPEGDTDAPQEKAMPEVPADVQRAAEKRAEAAKGPQDTEAARMIAALQIERRGYQQRGLTDRVAQVDSSIAAWKKKGKA